jgi:hypothetical protein
VKYLVNQLWDEDRWRHGENVKWEHVEIGGDSTGSALYSNHDRKRQWQSDQPPLTFAYCNQDGHQQNDLWNLHLYQKQN